MNKNIRSTKNNSRYKYKEFNNKNNEPNQMSKNKSSNLNINKNKISLSDSKNNNNSNINLNNNANSLNSKIKVENNNKIEKINFSLSLKDSKYKELPNQFPLDNEYNSYINQLKNKFIKVKVERRKKEEEATAIQHRITVLKNKEQSKIQQFKKMKGHINKILNNRIKIQDNLKLKLKERMNYKNKESINNVKAKEFVPSYKRKLVNTNLIKKPKQDNFIFNQNKFYHPEIDNPDFEEKNAINIDNFNINDDIVYDDNIYNIDNNSNNNIKFFKQKLIEKIRQDEEEKKRIEIEIAKIEEEENKLLNKFNNNKVNNYKNN